MIRELTQCKEDILKWLAEVFPSVSSHKDHLLIIAHTCQDILREIQGTL
jgi:hypothetical protein